MTSLRHTVIEARPHVMDQQVCVRTDGLTTDGCYHGMAEDDLILEASRRSKANKGSYGTSEQVSLGL